MSSGMNVKEAEKIADKMLYREAIMNCLHARCVPYRKATKIKMKRLLESIDNDFIDDLLNQGYTKGYQQGRADEQMHSIEDAKQQAAEYLNALNKAKEESYKRGASEFAEWLCQETDIAYVNYQGFATVTEDTKSIDKVLAEWQKGAENE